MREVDGHPIRLISALDGERHDCLERLVPRSEYLIEYAACFAEAALLLRDAGIRIVISPSCLGERYSWKDLLRETEKRTPAPKLIVTDRLADEWLWAEVLNLGGFDVLPQPFHPEEVARTLESARRSWETAEVSCAPAGIDAVPPRMTQIPRTPFRQASMPGMINSWSSP